jgi:hypothetical protein
MKNRFSHSARLGLLFASSLVVFACSGEQKHAAGSPEALLEAEGDWALVEDKQAPTPEQKHMVSRQKVKPGQQTQGHNAYTKKVAESGANDDVHFRVLRLERQMDALQGNFDKILPPLGQKAMADRELNKAVEEIHSDRLAEAAVEKAPPPPMLKAPVEKIEPYPLKEAAAPLAVKKEVVAMTTTPAPKSVSGGALEVSSVRVGEHTGSTRLVLDTSGPSKFTADLDAAENLLVVELPGVAWNAAAQKAFGNSPLLKSYSAQPSGGGTRLVIELKKTAKLTMKTALPPNEVHGHRIVFDLAAG